MELGWPSPLRPGPKRPLGRTRKNQDRHKTWLVIQIPSFEQAQKRIILSLQNAEFGQFFHENQKKSTKSLKPSFWMNLGPHEYVLGGAGQSQNFKPQMDFERRLARREMAPTDFGH